MTNLRGVLDTNVVLSADRVRNAQSTGNQLLGRCRDWWTALFSLDILAEYVEKLREMAVADEDIVEFVSLFSTYGEKVDIEFFHLRYYPSDPDDIAFLLCAWNGTASHL